MILFNDEKTNDLEMNGEWIACVGYLIDKWKTSENNISLFLKLAVTAWYSLTLDGSELSLTEKESEFLSKTLYNAYQYFSESLDQDENCQWLFGYMMTVRTDLFLNSGIEYNIINKNGENLIEQASNNRNLFAQLLFATENCSKKKISQCREKVKSHISEHFDDSQEVDQYFIEILTTQST